MAGKAKGSALTSLPGVGEATAKKLKAAKLGTVAKIAKASAGDLKKAGSKAKTSSAKASKAAKEATEKAVGKGQKVAEKVVEKTKAAGTSLKTSKDKDRKGATIKVPKSVKDMPWFKKG